MQNASIKSCNLKLSRPEDLLTFIVEYGDESVFPNIRFALQVMLTMPGSTASCERCFSKLKLILSLSYLRASMSQSRLRESEKPDYDKNHIRICFNKGTESVVLISMLCYLNKKRLDALMF